MTAKQLLAHDPALLTERELSGLVVELARLGHWRRYHTLRSKGSSSGYPDWCFVKPPRLLFVELKSEKGVVRPEQQEWIDDLNEVPGVEVYVWRPSDWDEIVTVMTGRKQRRHTDGSSNDSRAAGRAA